EPTATIKAGSRKTPAPSGRQASVFRLSRSTIAVDESLVQKRFDIRLVREALFLGLLSSKIRICLRNPQFHDGSAQAIVLRQQLCSAALHGSQKLFAMSIAI
ncbi:MAG TPA: hypothetical protein VFC21_00015, partial [Bryobacteraceae bacterium]|nr:hypothetical protein [Bryobacteraceae bacterium]